MRIANGSARTVTLVTPISNIHRPMRSSSSRHMNRKDRASIVERGGPTRSLNQLSNSRHLRRPPIAIRTTRIIYSVPSIYQASMICNLSTSRGVGDYHRSGGISYGMASLSSLLLPHSTHTLSPLPALCSLLPSRASRLVSSSARREPGAFGGRRLSRTSSYPRRRRSAGTGSPAARMAAPLDCQRRRRGTTS